MVVSVIEIISGYFCLLNSKKVVQVFGACLILHNMAIGIACWNETDFKIIHQFFSEQKNKRRIIILLFALEEGVGDIIYTTELAALLARLPFIDFSMLDFYDYHIHIHRITNTFTSIKHILIGLYAYRLCYVMVWSTYLLSNLLNSVITMSCKVFPICLNWFKTATIMSHFLAIQYRLKGHGIT